MPLLVTSASGANGDCFGALRGTFIDDDRIVDPRGLAVDSNENFLFLNSGADRVLAISSHGRIVRDTGRNERLSRVDTCKDEGHSDASSIKRVTSSSEGDCFVCSMKKGSLSAATKSRI
jgi:hypothetical protein